MKVTYCDACGERSDRVVAVEIPCHLHSKRGSIGYVDSAMNRISGRMDSLDLCNACSNRAYAAVVMAIDEIRAAAPKPGGGDE